MKTNQLKTLIKEVVRVVREAKIQDPTKQEMMSYLQKQYGREEGWKHDAEVAIYWFANFYHGGQWSNLYSALSTSPFNPGPIARGPQRDSMEEMMYRDLVTQFAGGEGLDDEDDDAFHQTDEMIGSQMPKKHPMDDYDVKEINAIAEKFNKEIEQLKAKYPKISFGYIGNVWNDARYQPQDDRAWYVWNGRNKWGGYRTIELPEMWEKWDKSQYGRDRFLAQPVNESTGSKRYTVRFVVLGREPTEETFEGREEAIRAARDFIKSVVTPGAKRAGEYVEAVKNGYVVKHVGGGTVAAAVIQGETMFQENVMNFDVNTFKKFKKEYERAVAQGKESFVFNGQEVLVAYAKYVIQYLEPKFSGIREAFMPAPEDIVEYVKEIPGAKPFVINTPQEGPQKFEFCIGRLPNGKTGVAVYAYRGDFAISVDHFNKFYGHLL